MTDESEPANPEPPASAPKPTARDAVGAVSRIAHDVVDHEHRLPQRVKAEAGALEQLTGLCIGDSGHSFEEVADAVKRLVLATPSSAGRRFDNQLFGGRDPVACLAEMLTPLLNTSMYTYKVAGPQVLAELEVLARLSRKIGFDEGEGTFTPGGSIGNMVAMAIARNVRRPDLRDQGMTGPRLTAYTSQHSHYSIRKNAGILGIGRANVRLVPVDKQGRMLEKALADLIQKDKAVGFEPFFVAATSGTTVLGAFDRLDAISELCREHGIWLHVDAALGSSLLLSEKYRHLLKGCHAADSFLWNAHKMMGVPLPCSALLLKRRGLLARSFNEAADYLFQADTDALNPGTRSIQCGRRNDALKLWAAWIFHGDAGYQSRLNHLVELAEYASQQIQDDPDLDLLHRPQSVNVCFEVKGVSSESICRNLDQNRRLKIGHAEVFGRTAIRLVCVNPEFSTNDIDRMLQNIKEAATEFSTK